jgi:hypothetical protein
LDTSRELFLDHSQVGSPSSCPFEIPSPSESALHNVFVHICSTVYNYTHKYMIWKKYWSSEITSGVILKFNLPLYKGFTLKITNKWWPLTTLNRWPLYRIKIYSETHRESTKVTVMSRWPLYKGDRYSMLDCNSFTVRINNLKNSLPAEVSTQWN